MTKITASLLAATALAIFAAPAFAADLPTGVVAARPRRLPLPPTR